MSGHKRILLGVLAASALILIIGCHRSISGSYLASDRSTVVWLQVVRTPDNHLTGQIAATVLKPDGTIQQNSASITGAVDGENVTIQGSRFFGLESFALSGTLSGNVLTLTGAQSAPLAFTRSTPIEFQARVAELNVQSQSIIQAKAATQSQLRTLEAQQRFVAELDSLTGKMALFDSEADDRLGKFPGIERGYKTITAEVAAYVERERQLAANPDKAVSRGQLSVAANQSAIKTEQMHNQVISMESSFEGNIKPRMDQAMAREQQCHAISQNRGNLTTAETQDVNAVCDRLVSAMVPFRHKYAETVDSLASLERVYQDERGKQQQLLQTAEKLQ